MGPRYVRLMEKSRGQKSRATVPLKLSAAAKLPGIVTSFLGLPQVDCDCLRLPGIA